MSLQEVFDRVYSGLRGQDFIQSTGKYGCQYRGSWGRKCAAGHFIPDEEYDPKMEGMCPRAILSSKKNFFSKEFRDKFSAHVDALWDLQSIHDDNNYPECMEQELHEFAERNHLTIPEVS